MEKKKKPYLEKKRQKNLKKYEATQEKRIKMKDWREEISEKDRRDEKEEN